MIYVELYLKKIDQTFLCSIFGEPNQVNEKCFESRKQYIETTEFSYHKGNLWNQLMQAP